MKKCLQVDHEIQNFMNLENDSSDVLAQQRHFVFEYVKFLQQDLVEKLSGELIDFRTENILLGKKND